MKGDLAAVKLKYKNIILRDMEENDLDDYIRWNTTETEWQNWDAPWEIDKCTLFTEQITFAKKLVNNYTISDNLDNIRKRFEICTKEGTHIGWINRYCIDENYSWSRTGTNTAIGIDIPSPNFRGHGCGENAMRCFMQYLFDNGFNTLYTQTWSGNDRMIHLAKKLGFKECDRKSNIRIVNGKTYDAVTFKIEK